MLCTAIPPDVNVTRITFSNGSAHISSPAEGPPWAIARLPRIYPTYINNQQACLYATVRRKHDPIHMGAASDDWATPPNVMHVTFASGFQVVTSKAASASTAAASGSWLVARPLQRGRVRPDWHIRGNGSILPVYDASEVSPS